MAQKNLHSTAPSIVGKKTVVSAVSKTGTQKHGFFVSAFRRLFHFASSRVSAIISARFGVGGKAPMTLEKIGKTYGITRERVRQIIAVLLKDIPIKRHASLLEEVAKKIEWTLKQHNGIITEEDFFSLVSNNNDRECGAVRFFLSVFSDRFIFVETASIRPSFALTSFSDVSWSTVNNRAKDIFAREGASLPEKEFLRRLMKSASLAGMESATLLNFLAVSKDIARNPFGQWGIPEWSDICPRGTKERAHIVVHAHGKPMHFREIAESIDRYGLQKRGKITHPQTVHNELIKDNRFVLVGRGTYALVEWGYKKGTVREVVKDILREHKKPMTREEIVAEVFKVRNVKESTIIINLNAFFERVSKDRYDLKRAGK